MASLSLGQHVRSFCNVRVSALLKGRSDVSTQFHIHWGLKPDQSVCVLSTCRLGPADCDVAALQQHKSVNHVTLDSFPGSQHIQQPRPPNHRPAVVRTFLLSAWASSVCSPSVWVWTRRAACCTPLLSPGKNQELLPPRRTPLEKLLN